MNKAARRLTARAIELQAINLLFRYGNTLGRVESPPVPIDDIAESFLHLTVEMYDLRGTYGGAEVLGAMIRSERLIRIDETLDPHEHPELEGRYNFTLAHEIGHWILHGWLNTADIPSEMSGPSRTGRHSAKSLPEWQADQFAAALLMPRHLVEAAWSEYGDAGPIIIAPEVKAAAIENFGSIEAFTEAVNEDRSSLMASRFCVSRQAMRIRLEELGILPKPR